ncbi:unnamed protein product [Zymoseptoria tritici ST99CH_3D7]|uniref:Uncharacterized protein n=1 Tax=Zymoseptoria tritici (strain ST99CH_3D7) TaxID=1276538 RepID=A0A1X7S2N5_ZYMT9|nr:unnamed protein product [Zymoseptoria tritici ST99CH_3D7]
MKELMVDEQLLVGSGSLDGCNFLQALPPSLEDLSIVTYGQVDKLGGILLQLDSLLQRGLGKASVSFPMYFDEFAGVDRLNSEFLHILCHADRMTSGNRSYFLDFDSSLGEKLVVFRSWALQTWADGLAPLANEVLMNGIKSIIELQLPNIWDSDSVLGEALMEAFGGIALAAELAGSQGGYEIEDVRSASAAGEASSEGA